jgi:pimeloyl-ACP methyl ester carboxylesterase
VFGTVQTLKARVAILKTFFHSAPEVTPNRVCQPASTFYQGFAMTILANLVTPPNFWSTTSDSYSTDTLSGDLSALGEHLGNCRSTHRHLLTLHCAAQSMGGFMATRFVTTVVLVVVFVGLNIWLF